MFVKQLELIFQQRIAIHFHKVLQASNGGYSYILMQSMNNHISESLVFYKHLAIVYA